MKAIIAVNNLSYIGFENTMLWHCKQDFEHFRNMTMGCKLLVGYITYSGLPALKGRELIIDQRNEFINNVDWCIGGKKTYEKYCHLFTELHISHINNNLIGSVMFPDLKNLNKNCLIYNYNF